MDNLTDGQYQRYKANLVANSEDNDLARFVLFLDNRLDSLAATVKTNRENLNQIPRDDLQKLIYSFQDSAFGNITISQQIRDLRQQITESEERQRLALQQIKSELEKKISESYKPSYDNRYLIAVVTIVVILSCLSVGGMVWLIQVVTQLQSSL